MKAVGWGIVGLGRAADSMIAPGIQADRNGRLVAVVSRDQGRARAFAIKHGAETAGTDFEAMLSNPDVDIVMITTPNGQHSEQVILAARAGKHVVCDKPLGLEATDARRALKACGDAGVQLGIMFESRRMQCFEDAREVIASGEIGDVLLAQIDFSGGRGIHKGWRAEPALAGLGSVFNLGVHSYDLLRYLLKAEVVEVSAMFDSGREGGMEMVAMVLARFSNGALAFSNANELTPLPLNQIVIHGALGRIDGSGITSPGKAGQMRFATPAGVRTMSYGDDECWAKTVAAFSQSVIDGVPFSPSGMDGVRSAELTDAIVRSARDGVAVSIGAGVGI